MGISFDSKGDFSGSLAWLDDIVNRDPTQSLQAIGAEGVKLLSSATPKDTGETASGWNYKIERSGASSEIAWVNNAHPETNVNLAVLIDKGHGTRNGGYVAPKPYIEKSIKPVFDTAADRLFKELTE